MANGEEKRFVCVYKQSTMASAVEILQDTVTGVQYLFRRHGYGGGLTPLLDREGKPVIGAALHGEEP